MSPTRVMLVDDTTAVRQVLAQILEEEPSLAVVGAAANGAEALEKLERLAPDILLLDIEMPEMGGLEFLRALRQRNRTLPVLLFSSLTERGAMVTIEALLLGANDYVPKPSMLGSAAAARDYIRANVLPRLQALLQRMPASAHLPPPTPAAAAPALASNRLTPPVEAVVIATSTGGPNALSALLPALPANFPVPVFMVQHMPAAFTQALAKRLDQVAALSVVECNAPAAVAAGTVWLAQGGRHLALERRDDTVWVRPDDAAPENFCRPSADVLLRHAVQVYGNRLLAVVLTGMGHDGLAGCRELVGAGGQVIVQDRASSVVWGMPSAVADAGLAQAVLPLEAIAAEIVQRVGASRPWFLPAPAAIAGRPSA